MGLAALKVAFAHLVFNVYGILLFLPIQRMRQLPIWLATKLGELATIRRWYAVAYIGVVFFVIPLLVILATRNIEFNYRPALQQRLEDAGYVRQGDRAPVDTMAVPLDTLSVPQP